MKPSTAALCLIPAAGLGFFLGWYPDRDTGQPTKKSTSGAVSPHAERSQTRPQSAALSASKYPALPELTSVESCRQFLKDIDNHYRRQHPLLRDTARDFALRRWLELDAESSLAEAERVSGSKSIGNDLFRVWLDLNPESAIAAWNQTSPFLAKMTRDSFLSTLAETDVARAFAILSSPRGRSEERSWDPAADYIFRIWAGKDPRAALEATKITEKTGPDGQTRPVYPRRDAVMEGWATSDPAGLLAYAKSGTDPDCTLKSVAGWLLPALLKSDPQAAAEVIEASRESTYGLTSTWAGKDPIAALAWAETQPADSKQVLELKVQAAGKLGTSDPLRAIALLDDYRSAGSTGQEFWVNEGYRQAFASLAASDPAKAMEMMVSQPEIARLGGMSGYMSHAFAKDPESALAQARAWLAIPDLASSVVPAISKAFSVSNGAPPRDFSPVLAAMPELAPQVDSETMRGWALAAPESAAEFLASRESGGKPVGGVKDAGVLTSIATARPEWTSEWVVSLPEGPLRQETAEILAANWSSFDPDASKTWIDSLPPGPSRESAVSAWEKRLEVPHNPFIKED